jgi:predicted ATPase/DNA-binding SARP family transcriptional activator
MTERLELAFLGAPHISINGQPRSIAERKATALLAYLAVMGEAQMRDTLAALLWPEHDAQRARANLRYTLWLLKTALGAEWFVTERESLGLHTKAAVWVDVTEFQTLVRNEPALAEDAAILRLEKAVELYRGDFLAGFTLADAPEFDDWQFRLGERLRGQLAAALEKLVYYYESRDAWPSALDYARRWLALDPLHEPVHRHLMRLYTAGGQRSVALRQYVECVRLLKSELDVAPEAETTSLYEMIRTRRYPAGEGETAKSAAQPSGTRDGELLRPAAQPGPFKVPAASTSFVGRKKELAQIADRFADPAARLVTIVGLGGMGKSRLAVEAAAAMGDRFADGLWFVALAPVASAGLIPSTLATALEIPIQGAADLEAHIMRYLGDKELLLILDNLEHLLDGTAFIERLLESAPAVKVLATSRVRLRLESEWLLPLDGLTVPASTEISTLTPAEYAAVDLFVQRARRLVPDFALTTSTAAEVVRICQLVGGMPLAIELAAAWLRSVPLAEIAGEIQANLDFLAASMRTDSQRHRDMRAVFDHSWRLLDERERQTLMRISVFRGGFTRQAAVEVTGATLHILSGLVDSSWLQLDPQGRYEIHELARQYAEEKLEAEAATATHARATHSAYYAALADRIGVYEGEVSGHIGKLNTLLLELDNIWAGWQWEAANRNFDQIGKYVPSLAWLADAYGLYTEIVGEFEKVCALAREKLAEVALDKASYRKIALELARILNELCFLHGRATSVELGLARGTESITLLRQAELDGRSSEALPIYLDALGNMSLVVTKLADYEEARLYCEEMVALTQGKNGYLSFYCFAINSLSQIAYLRGNYAEAERYLMECITKTPGDFMRTVNMDRLAHVYADQGDLAQAAQFAASAVQRAELAGNLPALASTLLAQTDVALALGRFEEVEESLGRVEKIAEQTGNRYVRVRYLNSKGRQMRLMGGPLRAQAFYREAYELADSMARKKDAALAQAGIGFALLDQENFEDARVSLRAGLRAAWEHRIMPEVTWAVVGLAALKGAQGEPQLAERWLRAAVAHPSCPNHVQVEAMEVARRLGCSELGPVQGAADLQGTGPTLPDTMLEEVVLEALL